MSTSAVNLAAITRRSTATPPALRGLQAAEIDSSRAHAHPNFGPISAAMLLGAWTAHDAPHLRQIAKRLFQLASRDAGAASTLYARERKA